MKAVIAALLVVPGVAAAQDDLTASAWESHEATGFSYLVPSGAAVDYQQKVVEEPWLGRYISGTWTIQTAGLELTISCAFSASNPVKIARELASICDDAVPTKRLAHGAFECQLSRKRTTMLVRVFPRVANGCLVAAIGVGEVVVPRMRRFVEGFSAR